MAIDTKGVNVSRYVSFDMVRPLTAHDEHRYHVKQGFDSFFVFNLCEMMVLATHPFVRVIKFIHVMLA